MNAIKEVLQNGLYYVGLPYSFNPTEAYNLALSYRNILVEMECKNYSPICETHTPHIRLMKENLDLYTNAECQKRDKELYEFYVQEDLEKANFFRQGATPQAPFAMFFGYGWNLKLPTDLRLFSESGMPFNSSIFDLVDQYHNLTDIRVQPISRGCLSEFLWGLQYRVPMYELSALIVDQQLVPCNLDRVYYNNEIQDLIGVGC